MTIYLIFYFTGKQAQSAKLDGIVHCPWLYKLKGISCNDGKHREYILSSCQRAAANTSRIHAPCAGKRNLPREKINTIHQQWDANLW